jgi:peptide chain release factor 2
MVQFEELLLKLQALKPEIDDLSDALGMKGMLSEIQQLELKATEPGFWDDVEKSQKVLQRTGSRLRLMKVLLPNTKIHTL